MSPTRPSPSTDTAWLKTAIATANVPTLACMLVQLTGEHRWIEPPYVPTRTRGLEDNDDGGLPEAIQQDIRDAALTALEAWFAGKPLALPDPSDELLLAMMSVTLGETIPAEYAPIIRHELQLAPRTGDHPACPAEFRALIIGAGISGLCAAVQFEAAGIPYVIVERREALGGVWFENRYPGAACDVPSHLYSFSFAPYPWSRHFAGAEEINRYLDDVADRHDIRRHIRFGLEVTAARFDDATGMWSADIVSADGARETLTANIVISGVGAFNKPRMPDVPGLDRFAGPSVHTARYPAGGLDLKGRNVVLVGNGASAMQVAPAIVDEVGSLTIVQRTPQWAAPFPKFKQPIPSPLQDLMQHVPLYRLWYRLRLSWAFNDKLYDALQQDPQWQGEGRSINAINEGHRRHLTAYIKGELGERQDLLDRVLPDYPPFGKRMLLDNGWFRALTREHVRQIKGGVVEVREHSVMIADGDERIEQPADVIIWATGFDVVNLLAPMQITGSGGRDLHADWDGDDARAYLGTVVPGYPNFFCLYGPNTQFGHGGSLITVLERQMHYVMSLLDQMFARGIATVDVRQDVHDAYNQDVDRIHGQMIWTYPGVENYCQNSKGRIVVNNPFRIIDVWTMTERANLADFVCTMATPAEPITAQAS